MGLEDMMLHDVTCCSIQYIYQHLHVGVINESPYTTKSRDLQTGHPFFRSRYGPGI